MISTTKNFLFIHVPKTGGNSVQNILKKYSDDKIIAYKDYQDGIERFEIENDKYKVTKHSTLLEYKQALEPNIYKNMFKIATLRNPWEMVVSYYFSPHRGSINWDRTSFINLLKNIKPLRYYITTNQKGSFLGDYFKNSFLKKIDNEIDFLLRFERLNDDFKRLCKFIGIPEYNLPVRNKSDRKHYSKYYDSELIKLVSNKFREEIKLGNYIFE